MARGKYLNLEEARKADNLKQFAKEHPSTSDKSRFNRLFEVMGEPPEEHRKLREHRFRPTKYVEP